MTSRISDFSSLETVSPQVHSDSTAKSRVRRTRPNRIRGASVTEKDCLSAAFSMALATGTESSSTAAMVGVDGLWLG